MLYFLECPYHTQSVKNAVINWTATYRRDSDIVAPYERWQYYDSSVTQIPQTFNYAANKTKKVTTSLSYLFHSRPLIIFTRCLKQFLERSWKMIKLLIKSYIFLTLKSFYFKRAGSSCFLRKFEETITSYLKKRHTVEIYDVKRYSYDSILR